MSDSLWPYELQSTRLPCPRDSLGKNTGWSGLPCSPPGALSNPGIEPRPPVSPALTGGFFTTSTTWEAPLWMALGTEGHPRSLCVKSPAAGLTHGTRAEGSGHYYYLFVCLSPTRMLALWGQQTLSIFFVDGAQSPEQCLARAQNPVNIPWPLRWCGSTLQLTDGKTCSRRCIFPTVGTGPRASQLLWKALLLLAASLVTHAETFLE